MVADLVETSLLMQGLLCARQFFSGQEPEKLVYVPTSIQYGMEWSELVSKK
jgi:hypothetical protein